MTAKVEAVKVGVSATAAALAALADAGKPFEAEE